MTAVEQIAIKQLLRDMFLVTSWLYLSCSVSKHAFDRFTEHGQKPKLFLSL